LVRFRVDFDRFEPFDLPDTGKLAPERQGGTAPGRLI
jgi:hypothetical protein